MNSIVEINDLNFYFDPEKYLFKNFNLRIMQGEFVCILGPSGCGKSTLLNLIAGFIRPKSGTVLTPSRISTVFQKHNLFPWKTIIQNIQLGTTGTKLSYSDALKLSKNNLAMVGLLEHENKYPHQLSLGMQQRVGLARAYTNEADLLLMDEPFGSLDAQTRYSMQNLLLDIHKQQKKSIFFITHDVDEAMLLADRIIVFSNSASKIKLEIHRSEAKHSISDRKKILDHLF